MTSSRSDDSTWVPDEIPLPGFAALATVCGSGLMTAGYGILSLAGVVSLTVLLLVIRRRPANHDRFRIIVLVFTSTLVISGLLACAHMEIREVRIESLGSRSSIRAVVVDDPRTIGRRTSVEARIEDLTGEPLILESWKPMDLEYGFTYTITGRFDQFGDSPYEVSLERKGVVGSFRVSTFEEVERKSLLSEVADLRTRTLSSLDGVDDSSVLLPALVCGHTSALSDSSLRNDASRTGLSHLLAVSGTHLVVIMMLINGIARVSRLPRAAAVLLTALLGIAFVVFSGLQISAIRSIVMAVLSSTSWMVGRRRSGLAALSIVTILLVVLDPYVVHDLSYQLSALSVLGIMLFVTPLAERIGLSFPRLPSVIVDAAVLTIIAQVVTLPLTIPIFSTFSLIAPLANLIIGPLVSALLALTVICLPVILIVGDRAGALVSVLQSVAVHVEDLISALSALPFAAVTVRIEPLILWMIVCGIAIATRSPAGSRVGSWAVKGVVVLASASIIVLALTPLFTPPRILVLDVGQAEAILIQDRYDTLLVDVSAGRAAPDSLLEEGVYGVGTVLLTHLHADHAGGLIRTIDIMRPRRILVPLGLTDELNAVQYDSDHHPPVREVGAGDEISVGRFEIAVLHPASSIRNDENEDALVLDVSFTDAQGRSLEMLLLSDVEKNITEPLAISGALDDTDVLKVAHHGSRNGTSAILLESVTPEVGVISVGADNRYGHPTPETLDLLARYGVETFMTSDMGTIELVPAHGGVLVRTEK